jgi:hypothetical protein
MDSLPCLLLTVVVPLSCFTHAIECTNAPRYRDLTMYFALGLDSQRYVDSLATTSPSSKVSPAGQPAGSSTQDAPHNIVSKHQDPLRLTSPRRPMQVYLMFAFDAAT